jgi:nitroimidazol reductase NimA-like FMN-containing flavoprotein (pyridoxamine 5'-phosphate oxidase superfamily)
MKHVEYAYTLGMDDAAVEERLRTTGTGVLALSRDGESYAIPLAHYYDGDGLYFRLGVTEGSRKQQFLESTETACYVLYDAAETDDPQEIDTWSVLVTGRLSELPPSERDRFDTAEINRRFTPIRLFDEDVDDVEIVIYELEITSITGRKTPEV